jgi:hypothetical protein
MPLTACQGGGANPSSFSTGNVAPAGLISAAPSAITFSGAGAAFARTVTITSSVALPAGTVSVAVASCGTGAAAIVTFGTPSGSGTTFSDVVTPQNAGTCTATISSSAGGSATVTFTVNTGSVTIAQFVSPNSASISITVVSVNGSPPTAAQAPVNPTSVALSTASGGNCVVSGSGETCTVPLPVPTGAVTYLFQLKDSASHVLGRSTVNFTVPGGSNQTFSAVVNGVVASVTVTLPATHAGTAFSGPITVQAFDASGALIVGSAQYANAFTLTDSDTTAHTSLTNNGVTAKTVTVLGPNDVVILNYDGAAIPPYTVTATIPP